MKVIFSRKAHATLTDIFTYVATESSIENAEKVLDEMVEKISILEDFPKIGKIFKGENIRFLIIGNYVAVYTIKNTTILISEIYRFGQNWK